jgi:hypothetical protein
MIRNRNLPSLLENNYYIPVEVENPETILAKQNALGFLDVLRDKIRYDHKESMTQIINNHEEIMKAMQYQAANNYISGLSSSDRLKIESVQTLPYVLEERWFGKRKTEGITIRVNLR